MTQHLWLDLGNTRLKYWLTNERQEVIKHNAQEHLQAPADVLLGLSDNLTQYSVDFIGVSSVLGERINKRILSVLQQISDNFRFAHVDADYPLLCSHYDATQLGVDRWLQMLGAIHLRQQQQLTCDNLLVIGCGTAVTIDIIQNAQHIGGYIFPSAYLQRKAIHQGTQQISIDAAAITSTAIATNTLDAVNHGIMLNIIGGIQTVINQFLDYPLVMTGGDATVFSLHFDSAIQSRIVIVDELLLVGLQQYFNNTF